MRLIESRSWCRLRRSTSHKICPESSFGRHYRVFASVLRELCEYSRNMAITHLFICHDVVGNFPNEPWIDTLVNGFLPLQTPNPCCRPILILDFFIRATVWQRSGK